MEINTFCLSIFAILYSSAFGHAMHALLEFTLNSSKNKLEQTFSQANSTGAVASPSLRSAAVGLPMACADDTKSSRSSTSWNDRPRLRPYWKASSHVPSSAPLSSATWMKRAFSTRDQLGGYLANSDHCSAVGTVRFSSIRAAEAAIQRRRKTNGHSVFFSCCEIILFF